MAVDNALSPHGGELIERVAAPNDAPHLAAGLPRIPVRDSIAREVINLAYGFFSPLEGFMVRSDVDSVVRNMTLTNGLVWSIPIVFDVSRNFLSEAGVAQGDSVLLTYQDQALAVLEVTEVFSYDLEFMAQHVYGTADEAHPGVMRTLGLNDTFLGGPLTLVNPPVINPPFDQFWKTPRQLRQRFADLGWSKAVAHQTRNVPHVGHEWLMKGAFLSSEADGILVSAVIGEKKPGDYIDEAIVLAHHRLREAGFFLPGIHETSTLMWDMRYAGPREAVFHAIVRKNLGCSHHMFGRDHAGVGSYYDTYAAHKVFESLPDLGIKSVLTLEWWYCPVCQGVAYEGLCGHRDQKQDLAGTVIRKIIDGGQEPAPTTLRAEILEVVRECADKYNAGSAFVTPDYLENRAPVVSMPILGCCTCSEHQPA
jgi:sulfate adenylyltransferase